METPDIVYIKDLMSRLPKGTFYFYEKASFPDTPNANCLDDVGNTTGCELHVADTNDTHWGVYITALLNEAPYMINHIEKLEEAVKMLLDQRLSSWHRFAEEGDEYPEDIKAGLMVLDRLEEK